MTIRHDVDLAIRKDLGDYDALREIISAQCSAVNIADPRRRAEHIDAADLQEIAVIEVDNAIDMGGAHELVNHFHRHPCTAPRWRNRGQASAYGLTYRGPVTAACMKPRRTVR